MAKRTTFSDEQLLKLHKFLKANALKLVTGGKISKIPYHPRRPELRDYQWLVVDVEGLGRVEMYFTGMTSHFKVKGIHLGNDQIEKFKLRDLHDNLNKAYNKKTIDDASSFFDAIP